MKKEEFILAVEDWYLTGSEDSITFLGRLYDKVTQPHWISVEDELPMEYEPVLAVVGGNHFAFVGICLNKKTWYCEIQNKAIEIVGITHWMHLPQPPSSSEFPNNSKKGGEE